MGFQAVVHCLFKPKQSVHNSAKTQNTCVSAHVLFDNQTFPSHKTELDIIITSFIISIGVLKKKKSNQARVGFNSG